MTRFSVVVEHKLVLVVLLGFMLALAGHVPPSVAGDPGYAQRVVSSIGADVNPGYEMGCRSTLQIGLTTTGYIRGIVRIGCDDRGGQKSLAVCTDIRHGLRCHESATTAERTSVAISYRATRGRTNCVTGEVWTNDFVHEETYGAKKLCLYVD